jgi:hypothetical protein
VLIQSEFGEVPWLTEAKEVAQNTAELYIHALSTGHPWRSLTHENADVILIPFYGFLSFKVGQCAGTKNHSHRVLLLAEFLVQQLPRFDLKSKLALAIGFYFPIHETKIDSTIHGELVTVLQNAVLAVYEKHFDARGEEGTSRRLMVNQTVVLPYVPNIHITAQADDDEEHHEEHREEHHNPMHAGMTRTTSFFFRGSAQLGYRTSPGRKLRRKMLHLFQARQGTDISVRYVHSHRQMMAHSASCTLRLPSKRWIQRI